MPHKHLRLTYAERRFMLLVELRFIRLTNPSRRVVKQVQRDMQKLRTQRRLMEEANGNQEPTQ